MLPTCLANPCLSKGTLESILPDWELPEMTIYALYSSRRHLSAAVRTLLDFLVRRFETLPW